MSGRKPAFFGRKIQFFIYCFFHPYFIYFDKNKTSLPLEVNFDIFVFYFSLLLKLYSILKSFSKAACA